MRRLARALTVLLFAGLAACAHPGPGARSSGAEVPSAGLEDQLAAARLLLHRGSGENDPIRVALGAELLAAALGRWDTPAGQGSWVRGPDAWLDVARRMAGTDTLALGVIQRVEGRRARGRTGGPSVRILSVSEDAPARIGEAFGNDGSAIVYAEGGPGTQLRLSVLDAAGTPACARPGSYHKQVCRWFPAVPADYTVIVSVSSPGPSEVLLITN